MTSKVVFADTYAIIATLEGKESYRRFLKHQFICCEGNLVELYYHLLRTAGKEVADRNTKAYARCVIDMDFSTIQEGMTFKLRHKEERLSYVDCIGYQRAKELGIPFLTGDEKFEGKENVLFVKAENAR